MSALVLLGVGIVMIVAEIFFGSVFLFFIGIGLCITSVIEYLVGFDSLGDRLVWQAVSICAFSLLSLLVLRKPIKSWFNRSQVYEDTLCEGGEGEIREGMVYFKGTLWAYENSQRVFKEGDKVKVIKIHNNKAIIENL